MVYVLLAVVLSGVVAGGVVFFTQSEDKPEPVAVATPPPPPPTPEPKPVEEPPEEDPTPDPGPDEPRVLDSGKIKKADLNKKPKKPSGPGKLVISSSPEMTLYVDGKKVGLGTATVEIKAGRHTVKGRGKGVSKTKRVTLRAGQTLNVALKVAKGGLVIDAPAGSVVYIDGKKVGKIPGLDVVDLYAGKHKVLVKNGAAQYRQTVPIRAGLDTTLTVNFYER
jgi:hypothetical protein